MSLSWKLYVGTFGVCSAILLVAFIYTMYRVLAGTQFKVLIQITAMLII